MDSIRYIKIKDVSSIIKDPTHPLFDATANGFDLDAIVALNYTSEFTNALESVKSEPVKLELSLNDKNCPKCGLNFKCTADESCFCWVYELNEIQLKALQKIYSDCLCEHCLIK